MRKYILIKRIDNIEEFDNVMDKINSITKEDIVTIHIESEWWTCWMFQSITKILNELTSEWYDIRIVAGSIISSAFLLYYNFKWKKELANDAEWLVHVAAFNFYIFKYNWEVRIRTNNTSDIKRIEELELSLTKEIDEIYSKILNKEEMEILLEWGDVYLWYKRLLEIFKE